MSAIETGITRITSDPHLALRRRAAELFVLAVASVSFIFVLAIAFGFISG